MARGIGVRVTRRASLTDVRQLLVLSLLLVSRMPVSAQPRDAGPPPKTIRVAADAAQGWTEGNWHVLLLRGNVVVEQNTTRVRMRDALIWMGAAQAHADGPLPVLIYGEGDVKLENGTRTTTQPKVFLQWQTTENFVLNAPQQFGRVSEDDEFYRRAMRERADQESAPPPPPESPPPEPQRTAKQPDSTLPAAATPPPGPGRRPKRVQVLPRGSSRFFSRSFAVTPDITAYAINGGVTILVEDDTHLIDLSTDRAVIWIKGQDSQGAINNLRTGGSNRDDYEIYLEGHVEILHAAQSGTLRGATRRLKADSAYYDVSRNVALLTNCELTLRQPGLAAPIVVKASEVRQVSMDRFEANMAEISASRQPGDPFLRLQTGQLTLEEREKERRGLFGRATLDPATGQPIVDKQLWFTAEDIVPRAGPVPIGYLPKLSGDVRDPLGPLESVRVRSDRIFGTGVQVRWDLFQLLGLEKPENTAWRLDTDYLSQRGPAIGTEFDTAGTGLFGLPGRYQTSARGYLISDEGQDFLGPFRTFEPPRDLRGRFLLRHRQEFDEHWSFLGQGSYLSDRNFLEMFYKREFDNDVNQETYAQLRYIQDQFAATLTAQPRLRYWVNETERLPELKGYIIGQDLFSNLFTYSAKASAGYLNFLATGDLPPGYVDFPALGEFERWRALPPSSSLPHTNGIDAGRFDLFQELSLPLNVGPFKLVPYGQLDLTYYTNTLTDEPQGRVYGGGGARVSLPLTQVFSDVQSELWNLNGIAHKISLEADYRYSQSDVNFRTLPLFDRLDDDATDQARRDLRLNYLQVPPNPTQRQIRNYWLATNPLFDPQLYALRRGYENSPENLDDLQFLRFNIRQRWQTKRGLPGQEHIIDWMTLNVEATYFPDGHRDNFGNAFGLLGYDYTWHVGDRTTLVSSGWADPWPDAGRIFNIGVFIDRPERLSYYAGFRHVDPINVNALILSTSYVLSPKYAITVASSYDFGDSKNLGNSVIFTRMGSDLQFSLGFRYDALRNNFGFTFEIFPALPGRSGRRLSSVASMPTLLE
jgi:hypothetical protein